MRFPGSQNILYPVVENVKLRCGNFHQHASVNDILIHMVTVQVRKIPKETKWHIWIPSGLVFEQDDKTISCLKTDVIFDIVHENAVQCVDGNIIW